MGNIKCKCECGDGQEDLFEIEKKENEEIEKVEERVIINEKDHQITQQCTTIDTKMLISQVKPSNPNESNIDFMSTVKTSPIETHELHCAHDQHENKVVSFNSIQCPNKSKETYSTKSKGSKGIKKSFTSKKSWRDIDVFNIVSQSKIISSRETDTLLQGELFQFSNIKEFNKQFPITKYLTISKTEILMYRSKEALVHMRACLQKINLHSVILCDSFVPKNQKSSPRKEYFYFTITYANNISLDNDFLLNKIADDSSLFGLDSSISNIQNDSSMMKNISLLKASIIKREEEVQKKKDEVRQRKPKFMSLLDEDEEEKTNRNSNVEDVLTQNNMTTLFFGSESHDVVNRWIRFINYLITK